MRLINDRKGKGNKMDYLFFVVNCLVLQLTHIATTKSYFNGMIFVYYTNE